jgi:serine-type D-Ala-D-Ala carboxypeptidase (penicillin-binding protein 5/6)
MKKLVLLLVVILVAGIAYQKAFRPATISPATSTTTPATSSPNVFDSQKSASPKKNANVEDLKLVAESAVSVWVSSDGNRQEVLFEKNPDEQLLIASLTKLMTADIVLENYNLSDDITVSSRAVTEGGYFKTGDTFPVKAFLNTMLMGQDNIAAYALSEKMGTDKFVSLMNQKAKDLGLADTFYSNAVGSGRSNHSTANELVKLAKWLLASQPSIFSISIMPEFDIYDQNNVLRYKVKKADILLNNSSLRWSDTIIGSKLANNSTAGQCILLVLKSPDNSGYLINVILKSNDRFGEMKKLVNWVYDSYNWNS